MGSFFLIGAMVMIVMSATVFQPLVRTGFDPMPENIFPRGRYVGENGSRYTFRQPDDIREADELALKGSMAMVDEKYTVAISSYFHSMKRLPNWEMNETRRSAYRRQFWNAVRRSIGF